MNYLSEFELKTSLFIPPVNLPFVCIICKFITRYHGPRVMQKYEIREEMIKVKISNSSWLSTTTLAQVVRIGSDKTEAVEVLFILA